MGDAPRTASEGVLGVVTVLFGGEEHVEGFFTSLAMQSEVPLRLYVIDNNPTPALSEVCRGMADRLGIETRFLFPGSNVGVAGGNNLGIEMALDDGCRWVLLANNDTEFGPGTLRTLLEPLHDGDVAVTPKILYPAPGRRIWFACGRLDRWISPTVHVGAEEQDRGQFDGIGYTEYAPACFLTLDASVFARVGVMDAAYFAYYDDTDFVWRMRTAGVRIRYQPDAVVVHKVGGSTGGPGSPFVVFHGHRNRIYFMRKHFRGVERVVGLGYFLLSRIPKTFMMPRPLARRMWAGVWAGLRLPVSRRP